MLNHGNASRSSNSHGSVSGLERLEERRMMSTSALIGSELRVVGDAAANNNIDVSLSADGSKVVVNINGRTSTFARPEVRRLRVTGGKAVDAIVVDPAVNVRSVISGKNGDDTISAGSGNDIVRGGSGNDTLNGGAGNDRIYGGAGRDSLDGAAGRNVLRGGEGVNNVRATPDDSVVPTETNITSTASLQVSSRVDTAANVKLLAQWMKGGLGAGKKVFDATFYTGGQDLRPQGFTPLYVGYDGDLNRAIPGAGQLPGIGNSFPQANRWSDILAAYKRLGRAAAGVEDDIPNHRIIQPTYNKVAQMIAFDLEDQRFMALDASADPVKRREVIGQLCTLIDAVKAEQLANGVQSPGVGIFLWPPAFWSGNIATNNYHGDIAQAKADFAPLVARVDAFFPELYIHSDDTAAWKRQVDKTLADCRAADPTKPIYPFIAPHYAHYASADKLGKPLSKETWRYVTETILRECQGAVVWGGIDMAVGGNGAQPLPWGDKIKAVQASNAVATPTSSARTSQASSARKREPVVTLLQDNTPLMYPIPLHAAA